MTTDSIRTSILETCRAAARELTKGEGNQSAHRIELRDTYEAVLSSRTARTAAAATDHLFTVVTRFTRENEPAIQRVVNGWGQTHVSSDLVIQLAIRLGDAGALGAGQSMLKVAADDIGVGGKKPHRDMFADFANSLCTRDSWRAPENAVPAAETFRKYLTAARVKASLAEGILTTAASEIWNVGEYTTLAEKFRPWMQENMGMSLHEATKANAYVAVHSGNTELDHFLLAIDAWDQLAKHTNSAQPVADAGKAMTRYLEEITKAYAGLAGAIGAPFPVVETLREPKSPLVSMSVIAAQPGGIR